MNSTECEHLINTVDDKRLQFRLLHTVKFHSFIWQVAQEEVTMQNCVWCRNCHSATRQPLFDAVTCWSIGTFRKQTQVAAVQTVVVSTLTRLVNRTMRAVHVCCYLTSDWSLLVTLRRRNFGVTAVPTWHSFTLILDSLAYTVAIFLFLGKESLMWYVVTTYVCVSVCSLVSATQQFVVFSCDSV
jgi:hypothetical protein